MSVLAQMGGQVEDWQPEANLSAAERIQAAARAAATSGGQTDAYKAILDDGNATSTTVEPAAAPVADGNVSAPYHDSVTAFFSGNTTSPSQPESTPPAQTDAKAPENARPFSVPPLLGAQEEVKQAEEIKAVEAKEAAAAEAAAAAEQAKKDTEETANTAKAKAAEDTKQATEAAKKAAAEANASAPLSTSVTAFTGEITGNSTMNSVVPLSLLSIRPADPPVGQLVGHPKAYERKRSLLWNALSAGMSISPHHDMPVSRSLSLIEFVHTTQSHTVLLGVVPGLVLLLVCAALVLEGVGMTGMLKG